jgi:DNA-binding CsgD family transcriptional regulator
MAHRRYDSAGGGGTCAETGEPVLPFQFLDMVDGLTRLDPVRTYPQRAGELVARLCGAEGFSVEIEGGESVTNEGVSEGKTRIVLPLRYGRQALGQVVLLMPEGKDRLEAHDLRTARWAARIMGRCLNYSARMRHEPRKNGIEDVSEALHKAPLTPRERDVVALLMSGASTRQIASETHLTVGTVHTYLKRIYPKLGVRSRVELVARMIGTDGMMLGHEPHRPPPDPGPEVMN